MTSTEITTSNTLTKVDLREIAGRIRGRTAQAIIENGHDLLKAKAALPHGKFTTWLQERVEMTERTAQRCMQVAEWVASLPEGKTDTVTVLPPNQLYLLSAPSTPKQAQEQVLGRLGGCAWMSQAELRKIVRDAQYNEARMRGDWREADKIMAGKRAETAVTGDGGEDLVEPPETREKPEEDELKEQAAEALQQPLNNAPPKPEQRRRTQDEIERDAFMEGRLPVLEQAASVRSDFTIPKLSAEEAEHAIKRIREAEACLRQWRRQIEKQHSSDVADQAVDDDADSSRLPWRGVAS